jgi:hypothetical protein
MGHPTSFFMDAKSESPPLRLRSGQAPSLQRMEGQGRGALVEAPFFGGGILDKCYRFATTTLNAWLQRRDISQEHFCRRRCRG